MKQIISNTTGRTKNGFTFAEIMITLALFMVLASVGVGAYFDYYRYSLVNHDVINVTKVLNEARFKALKNPYHSDYGVHLCTGTDELTIFRDNFLENDPENIVVPLEQLEIENLNLLPEQGVTNNIIFENGTGKTTNTGSFTIGEDEYSFTYYINEQGAFEQ